MSGASQRVSSPAKTRPKSLRLEHVFYLPHRLSLMRARHRWDKIYCLIPRSVLLYLWWICGNRGSSLTAHHSSSPIRNAAQASHPIFPHHVVPFLRACLGGKLANQLLGAPSLRKYILHLNLTVALTLRTARGLRVRLRIVYTTTTDYKNDRFRSIPPFNLQ